MTNQSNNNSALANYDANNDPLCNVDGCDYVELPFDRMLQINKDALPDNNEPIYIDIQGKDEQGNRKFEGLFSAKTGQRVTAIFGLRIGRIAFKTVKYANELYGSQEKINVICLHEGSKKRYCFTAGTTSWWTRTLITHLNGMVNQGMIQEQFQLSTAPGKGSSSFANISCASKQPKCFHTDAFWKDNKANQDAISDYVHRSADEINNAILGIQTAQVTDVTPLALEGAEDDNDMPLEFLDDEQTQPAPAA